MTGAAVIFAVAALKALQFAAALAPWCLGFLGYATWALLLLALALLAQALLAARVLAVQPFDRYGIKRRIGFHEMATYMTASVMLLPIVGPLGAFALAFLPVLWLGAFLMMQYGELMADV